MYDRQFFQTLLGKAALASIIATVAFNILALTQQLPAQPLPLGSALHKVELA